MNKTKIITLLNLCTQQTRSYTQCNIDRYLYSVLRGDGIEFGISTIPRGVFEKTRRKNIYQLSRAGKQ